MKFLLDMPVSFLLLDVLQKVAPEVLGKSICVVDKKRIRVTHLPFERKP